MSKHLQRDLDKLKKELLSVCSMAEEATNKAVISLLDCRPELAKEVIDGDEEIDRREVELEEDCLKILALHQPVAADLRFIVTALKVNNDLERIADLSVNIAERALLLSDCAQVSFPEILPDMVETVLKMLRGSLDALVRLDVGLAREIIDMDDDVDSANRDVFSVIQKLMREHPDRIERLVPILIISRNLERIADQATNIAEDVVFTVEGEVIRHEAGARAKQSPAG